MAQRSHVPKFGNWDGEENVPYTAYFEKARKGRSGGKIVNPNDPEENPDLASDTSSLGQAPRSRPTKPAHDCQRSREDGDFRKFAESPARHDRRPDVGRGVGYGEAPKPAHDRQRSREDGDFRKFAESPARHDRRPDVGRGVGYGEAPRRASRQGPGSQSVHSDSSMEQSPLHPRARTPGRNPGWAPSPSWEGGKGSYESSHGTPGRSRLKPKGDDSPDKSAAVPKFGEWDESDPTSGDVYTQIFNKVKEEKQTGLGKGPGAPSESPYSGARRHPSTNSSKSCCFPWGRK